MLKELWRKNISSWKFLELVEIDLEWWKKYEACSRVWSKNAVAWIIRHIENNSYILIEQYRYPVKRKVLELVAWIIDKPNLSNEEILREEIIEETWYYDIKNTSFLFETSGSAWKSTETTFLYDVEIFWEKKEQNLWEMEDIKVLEIPEIDFYKFLLSKQKDWVLIDPKVCMILYVTLKNINNLNLWKQL